MTLTNFNATTPQLRAIENLFKAMVTLDTRNLTPFVSKDLKFQTFRAKIVSLPDKSPAEWLERYGNIFSSLKKVEVCIQHRLGARRLRPIILSTIFTK